MQKLISSLICLAIIVALSACGKQTTPAPGSQTPTTPGNQPAAGTTGNYKNGTYEAFGDKWQYGQESSLVTIENQKITNIVLKRLDINGKEVNYDEWVGQKEANGQIKPNLKQFRVDMSNRMLAKQSTQVDTIATATQSTTGWKVATQRALEQAKSR